MYALAIGMLIMQILVFEIYQIGWRDADRATADRQVLRDFSVFSSAIRSTSAELCRNNQRKVSTYVITLADVAKGINKTGELWMEPTDWCTTLGDRECHWGSIVQGRTMWLYRVQDGRSRTQEYAGLDGLKLGTVLSKVRGFDNFQLGIWPVSPAVAGVYQADLPQRSQIPVGSLVRYEHLCAE